MQHVSVLPEHVDLLHARDRLYVQLLQRTLELLVVLCILRFRFAHDFSPHGPLPAWEPRQLAVSKNRTKNTHHPKNAENSGPPNVKVDVPILFEAACACSLANFATSMDDIIWDLWLVLCRWPKKQGLTGGYQILANKYVFGKTSECAERSIMML